MAEEQPIEMIRMTLEEATKKYVKNGVVNLPPNLYILPPPKPSATEALANARKNAPQDKSTFIGDVEIRDSKVFVDGVETDKPVPGINLGNRAQRRAAKK